MNSYTVVVWGCIGPDHHFLSVCQVVLEHLQIKREPSSPEMSISLQSSEPVTVRDTTFPFCLSYMSPKLLLLLLRYRHIRI